MLTNWIATFRAWWQKHEAIRRLNALDEHLLVDMGTSRNGIVRFVSKPTRKG